jgi:hypothetical protein
MSSLRRVSDDRAGPSALGILVPPGRHTFVILRPRALDLDLLLVKRDAAGNPSLEFRPVTQAEAASLAQALYGALQAWAAGGSGRVEVVPAGACGAAYLRAQVGVFPLVACRRTPGKPYQPAAFAEAGEAEAAAAALRATLCPPAGGEQEVYLNTRNFAR